MNVVKCNNQIKHVNANEDFVMCSTKIEKGQCIVNLGLIFDQEAVTFSGILDSVTKTVDNLLVTYKASIEVTKFGVTDTYDIEYTSEEETEFSLAMYKLLADMFETKVQRSLYRKHQEIKKYKEQEHQQVRTMKVVLFND